MSSTTANDVLRASGGVVLVTGATGYIGRKLSAVLARSGKSVRCLVRTPERAGTRTAGVEVVTGDVRDAAAVSRALASVDSAYYLVHSMAGPGNFEEEDRRAARVFAERARAAGIRRIVYLGGLGEPGGRLSAHLRSRHETGELLRQSGVPVLELRSSIVIGCGSTSFEMIRALVERLPVMVTPRWVSVITQPIGIDDLIEFLRKAIEIPLAESLTVEIGGPDRVSYGDLMQEYARQRGLRRLMIPVPVLTPRLSSLWLALVTPHYADVGRHLVDSLRNPTVVRDPAALQIFDLRPCGVRDAMRRVLAAEDREFAEAHQRDLILRPDAKKGRCGIRIGSRILDSRTAESTASAAQLFAVIEGIGGVNGWYYANWLWQLRGLVDVVVGGVGLRRGRRHPGELRAGDTLDYWRVELCERPHRLLLRAEMKMPGETWLEFDVEPTPGGSSVRQTAVFKPRGLFGLAYWCALFPIHDRIFGGMLRRIARAASARIL